jgi:hypothetical protein
MVREMSYAISPLVQETAKEDRGAAMSFFLLDNVKSIFGVWVGRMSYADQRALFGKVIGKGRIYIDGAQELVDMSVSMAFGQDRDVVWSKRWSAIVNGSAFSA